MSANKSQPNSNDVPTSLGTKVPHPHAESMLLYAQDAMETDRPWERLQFKHESETNWCSDAGANFGWLVNHDYRRKPLTILINGIEVPKPYYGDIDDYTNYYFIDFSDFIGYGRSYWDGCELDMKRKGNGILHLTEENARKHAEALLSFTKV